MEQKIHEIVAIGIGSGGVAQNLRTASAQGTLELTRASVVELCSVSVYAKVITNNGRVLKYNAPDRYWNTLAPAPQFDIEGYTGYLNIKNETGGGKLLSSAWSYTVITGNLQSNNTAIIIPLNEFYKPREPLPLVLQSDKIGLIAQVFWNYPAGYGYGDASDIACFFFINLELFVKKL